MAIASLVLGICGILTCGATALVGLILGIVALLKIGGSEGRLQGKGLAIGGIVTSSIMLLLVPLTAILIPALSRGRQVTSTGACANNLRNLGYACLAYANDNRDRLPDRFSLIAGPYLMNDFRVFLSPFDTESTEADVRQSVDANSSYVLVPGLRGGGPGNFIAAYSLVGDTEGLHNVLFLDMRVEQLTVEEIENRLNRQLAAMEK
jgi:hypothetical protein